MALVDFSNAHIECLHSDAFSRVQASQYNRVFGLNGYLAGNSIESRISQNADGSLQLARARTDYFSSMGTANNIFDIGVNGSIIIRSGTCTCNGDTIYFIIDSAGPTANYDYVLWKITNIEYETNDTFSFQITINCDGGE